MAAVRSVLATAVVATVLLLLPAGAVARTSCSSSFIGPGGGVTVKAYAESAVRMRCSTVHQLLRESWIWRSGTLVSGVESNGTPTDLKGAPGYPCKGKVYVPSPNFVLSQIQGATETCSRGRSSFSFTWGRRSQLTVPG